jgi:polyribonucleotide nucleotidyltransferase
MMCSAGRREIGHSALGEHSVSAVVPDKKSFPYTIRIASDILESNGSRCHKSNMALENKPNR